MNLWLRKGAVAIVGVFAFIGVFVVGVQIFGIPFVTSCERVVLASAVSPSGNRVAEHVRLVCEDPLRIAHTISIGPVGVPSAGNSYRGYQFYEDKGEKQDVVERIKAAVLWWDADDQLSVIYPRGTEYVERIEISGVTLRAAAPRQVE